MKGAAISVAVSATLLASSSGGGQCEVKVSVPSASTVAIGDSTVTATTGLLLVGPTVETFRIGPHDKIYGAVTTGSVAVTVSVAELGFE